MAGNSKQICICPKNKKFKGNVYITIETCKRRKHGKHKPTKDTAEKGDTSSESKTASPDGDSTGWEMVPYEKPQADEDGVERPKPPPPGAVVLPVLTPRYHGAGCCMEINVMERHSAQCGFQKAPNAKRGPEDSLEGYDIIGRLVMRSCNPDDDMEPSPPPSAPPPKPTPPPPRPPPPPPAEEKEPSKTSVTTDDVGVNTTDEKGDRRLSEDASVNTGDTLDSLEDMANIPDGPKKKKKRCIIL